MRMMTAALFALLAAPAIAQDIRGLEVCTAEKQMERRTGCLQTNDQFLQQALTKHSQDSRAQCSPAGRELASAKAEIAALKARLAKLDHELALLKTKAANGEK